MIKFNEIICKNCEVVTLFKKSYKGEITCLTCGNKLREKQ